MMFFGGNIQAPFNDLIIILFETNKGRNSLQLLKLEDTTEATDLIMRYEYQKY